MFTRVCCVTACVALAFLSACGRTAPVATDDSTTTTTTPAAPDQDTGEPVPHYLLDAEGWTLQGGTDSGPMIEAGAALGIRWNASYDSWPEPNHEIGAALAVSDPPRGGAREYASLLTSDRAREVTVAGHTAYGGEERGTDDDRFIASHIAWDAGDYVVTLTVYETHLAAALRLAEHVSAVSAVDWRRAMDAARP